MDGNIKTKKKKKMGEGVDALAEDDRRRENREGQKVNVKDGERRLATERAEACDSTARLAGRPEEEKK